MSKHLSPDVRIPIEPGNPAILREELRCIKCGACCYVCREEISVGRLYDLGSTGDVPICVHCGQCANVCPTGAIHEVYDYQKVRAAVADPDKIVVFSTSPSVRVGLGEEFAMAPGSFVEGQMVAALRALGADYVLDTNFSADLTIMEEAGELVQRLTKKTGPLPQFTSCCPAWVKFVETFYPALRPNLSSAKSPIGMQGPTVKTYFAKRLGLDPQKIVNVALTPCTAKKFEISRPEMNASARENGVPGMRDMDYVITTRELARWMKEEGVMLAGLPESSYDSLMGAASGAGVIFGNTGGVMEAAVRTAYWAVTGQNPPKELLRLTAVRGMEGIREASLMLAGTPVRVAVVHGLENARKLAEKILAGEADYAFVEVMTCRGGCIGGGGQPKTAVPMSDEVRAARIQSLYARDEAQTLRLSHENPQIQAVYEEFYGKPLSPLAEALLHTAYADRSADLGGLGAVQVPEPAPAPSAPSPAPGGLRRFRCRVCGHVAELAEMPAGYKCPICGVPAGEFEEI